MAPESRCGREKWVFNLSEKECFRFLAAHFLQRKLLWAVSEGLYVVRLSLHCSVISDCPDIQRPAV